MIKGSLRCLGSSQHLKSTYGNAYQISLKTTPARVDSVLELLHEMCPNGQSVRNINGAIDFEVPAKDLALGSLFATLSDRADSLDITDYSISQPTLEQVFLGFAREQEQEVFQIPDEV